VTLLQKNHKSGVKLTQVDSLGFGADHDEAKDDIDKIIEVKWFKPRVRAFREGYRALRR